MKKMRSKKEQPSVTPLSLNVSCGFNNTLITEIGHSCPLCVCLHVHRKKVVNDFTTGTTPIVSTDINICVSWQIDCITSDQSVWLDWMNMSLEWHLDAVMSRGETLASVQRQLSADKAFCKTMLLFFYFLCGTGACWVKPQCSHYQNLGFNSLWGCGSLWWFR